MCVICQNKCYDLEYIDCGGCANVREIKNLPNMNMLICSSCPNIKKIYNNPSLKYIYANDCPQLNYIGTDMPKLTYLSLKRCPELITINSISGLTYLDCEHNINLVIIEFMEMLEFLNCGYCPKLIYVPAFEKFTQLHFYKTDFCPWIIHRPIVQLIILPVIIKAQKMWKKKYRQKKLLALRSAVTPQFLPTDLLKLILDYDIETPHLDKLPKLDPELDDPLDTQILKLNIQTPHSSTQSLLLYLDSPVSGLDSPFNISQESINNNI